MNSSTGRNLLAGVAVVFLACTGFVVALLLRVDSPRIVAALFVLAVLVATWLFWRGLQDSYPSKQPGDGPGLTFEGSRGLSRQIWFSKAFLGLLIVCLVVEWTFKRNVPIGSLAIGTLVTLGWITGTILRIRQLRHQMSVPKTIDSVHPS